MPGPLKASGLCGSGAAQSRCVCPRLPLLSLTPLVCACSRFVQSWVRPPLYGRSCGSLFGRGAGVRAGMFARRRYAAFATCGRCGSRPEIFGAPGTRTSHLQRHAAPTPAGEHPRPHPGVDIRLRSRGCSAEGLCVRRPRRRSAKRSFMRDRRPRVLGSGSPSSACRSSRASVLLKWSRECSRSLYVGIPRTRHALDQASGVTQSRCRGRALSSARTALSLFRRARRDGRTVTWPTRVSNSRGSGRTSGRRRHATCDMRHGGRHEGELRSVRTSFPGLPQRASKARSRDARSAYGSPTKCGQGDAGMVSSPMTAFVASIARTTSS